MYANLELFIDGKWLGGNGRRGEDVINPATEKPLAHLPHASQADLDAALEHLRVRHRVVALGRDGRVVCDLRSIDESDDGWLVSALRDLDASA